MKHQSAEAIVLPLAATGKLTEGHNRGNKRAGMGFDLSYTKEDRAWTSSRPYGLEL